MNLREVTLEVTIILSILFRVLSTLGVLTLSILITIRFAPSILDVLHYGEGQKIACFFIYVGIPIAITYLYHKIICR